MTTPRDAEIVEAVLNPELAIDRSLLFKAYEALWDELRSDLISQVRRQAKEEERSRICAILDEGDGYPQCAEIIKRAARDPEGSAVIAAQQVLGEMRKHKAPRPVVAAPLLTRLAAFTLRLLTRALVVLKGGRS